MTWQKETARVRGVIASSNLERISSSEGNGLGDEDLAHADPLTHLPKLPRAATRRVLLGRDQDFVAGIQRDPDALQMERLRRVPREREFVRLHRKQAGEPGQDVFRDPGAQIRAAARRKFGHGPVSGRDRVHDLSRRHPDACVVQVGRTGLDEEVRAHLLPVRVSHAQRRNERWEVGGRRVVPVPDGAGGQAQRRGAGRTETEPVPPVHHAVAIGFAHPGAGHAGAGHGQHAELRVKDIEFPLGKRRVNASPSISTPVGSNGPSPSRAVIASGLAGSPAIVRP